MDYVRDGEIQSRSFVFLKVHCPCILPSLTQSIPKNIPKTYLKFAHPVHDSNKTSIVNFFDFTSLTYLQVVQKGFQDHYQKFYIVKALYTCTYKQQIFYSIVLFHNRNIFQHAIYQILPILYHCHVMDRIIQDS